MSLPADSLRQVLDSGIPGQASSAIGHCCLAGASICGKHSPGHKHSSPAPRPCLHPPPPPSVMCQAGNTSRATCWGSSLCSRVTFLHLPGPLDVAPVPTVEGEEGC